MKLHSFYTESPKEGKQFIALFDDGSGANLFYRTDAGDCYNASGEIINQSRFLDSGYIDFAYLPDDYKLFYQHNSD